MARKRLLKNLTIREVSLVDDPANEQARVVIAKAKDADEDSPTAADLERLKKALNSFTRSGGSPELVAALSAMENDMDIETLTKALEKAEASLKVLEKRATDAEAKNAEHEATIAKMKADHAAEIEKAKAPLKTEDKAAAEEAFLKSLPEGVRAQFEAGKQAQADIEKMKEERDTEVFIEKAKGYGVAADAKALGGALYRIAKGKATEDDIKAIDTVLKAAGEQAKTALLYKSAGVNLPASVDGDPEALLKAKAEEIQKAKNIPYAQAYDEAMTANPALYDAYVAKTRRPSAQH